MLVDRAVRREPEVIADLAVRWRNPPLLLKFADEVQDVPLPFRQIFHVPPSKRNIGGNRAKVKRKLAVTRRNSGGTLYKEKSRLLRAGSSVIVAFVRI